MCRKGTSLIEVLIAIFVMSLGLIALLTLFPVGASQMAKSIQNERAAQVAASAASYFRLQWRAMCEAESASMKGASMFRIDTTEPNLASDTALQQKLANRIKNFVYAMDDPNAGNINFQIPKMSDPIFSPMSRSATGTGMGYLTQAATNINTMAVSNNSSFPLMLDPVGWEAGSKDQSLAGWWMGPNAPGNPSAVATTAIPRRTMPQFLAPTTSKSEVVRNFFLLDDLTFEPKNDGSSITAANTIERAGQYSYGFLLRRPMNSKRTDVNLSVVVYMRRPIDSPSPEPTYRFDRGDLLNAITVTPGQSQPVMPDKVTLTFANAADKPELRRGSWILDATVQNVELAAGQREYFYQGHYYRVNDVREPIGNKMDIYLDEPLRLGGERLKDGSLVPTSVQERLFIIPSGVLEVFDKGVVSMVSPNRVN